LHKLKLHAVVYLPIARGPQTRVRETTLHILKLHQGSYFPRWQWLGRAGRAIDGATLRGLRPRRKWGVKSDAETGNLNVLQCRREDASADHRNALDLAGTMLASGSGSPVEDKKMGSFGPAEEPSHQHRGHDKPEAAPRVCSATRGPRSAVHVHRSTVP